MSAQLAVFPKCCLDDLIVHRTLTLFGWINMAMTLPYVRDRNSIRHFSSRLSHSYLEACRKARRLSRAQLAALLHTSETTIWRIENNQQEPGGALLAALLDAVGADFNELVRLALHPSADQHAQAGTSEEGASSDPRSGVREAPAPYTAALEVSVRQLDTLQLIDLLQLVSDVLRERYGEPARDASTWPSGPLLPGRRDVIPACSKDGSLPVALALPRTQTVVDPPVAPLRGADSSR